IEFKDGSTGNVLDHVEVRYGGGYGASALLVIGNAGLTVSHTVIRNSYSSGVRITGGKPSLTNDTFQDSFGPALSMDLASSPTIVGPVLNNNGVNGLAVDSGSLLDNESWDDPDIVYNLTGTGTISTGKTLTIAAGQI